MSRLELTGVIYPPALSDNDPESKSLGHQCEEFTKAEIDDLIRQLPGLKVCVEHDMDELVGHVIGAERIHGGAVQVRAVVNASTAAGKRAIQQIKSEEMVGLSLSHVYEFNVDGYSEKDRQLRIAMNQGDSWKQLQTERGGVQKLCASSVFTHSRRGLAEHCWVCVC